MTKIHSEECVNVNQGALVCCPSILDGDQPLVVAVAQMFDFQLNGNSINGVGCEYLYFLCRVTYLSLLVLGWKRSGERKILWESGVDRC